MAFKLFGFEINKIKDEPKEQNAKSFVPPDDMDPAHTVEFGIAGAYGQFVDMEGTVRNEADLINKYRQMVFDPEMDFALEEITNEAIVIDNETPVVTIELDECEGLSESLKNKIKDEFVYICKLINFTFYASEIFRRWYIDGRLVYHIVIDKDHPEKGILELRPIDPTRIRKIREIRKQADPKTGVDTISKIVEYYIYDHLKSLGINVTSSASNGLRIAKDSITFVPSGIYDQSRRMTLSYLQKSIKPLNQLRMMEDAALIYFLARAPERRAFYIDVGNLPKLKAEQYLRDIMLKYKNKIVYDVSTGSIQDSKKHMSMIEDFWLPRREGGRGTEVETLAGAGNLQETTEVIDYFKKRLYRSLNIPIARLEADTGFNLGKASEISRDEVKFSKFINKLRRRFSVLFDDPLGKHLVLKRIMTWEEWLEIKQNIIYRFATDSHFAELKESELLNDRLNIVNDAENYVGKYFSRAYIRKKVLKQSEDEIEEIDKEIEEEIKQGKIEDPNGGGDMGDDNFGGGGDESPPAQQPSQNGQQQSPPEQEQLTETKPKRQKDKIKGYVPITVENVADSFDEIYDETLEA